MLNSIFTYPCAFRKFAYVVDMFSAIQSVKARPAIYAVGTIGIVATGAYAGADIKVAQQTRKACLFFPSSLSLLPSSPLLPLYKASKGPSIDN